MKKIFVALLTTLFALCLVMSFVRSYNGNGVLSDPNLHENVLAQLNGVNGTNTGDGSGPEGGTTGDTSPGVSTGGGNSTGGDPDDSNPFILEGQKMEYECIPVLTKTDSGGTLHTPKGPQPGFPPDAIYTVTLKTWYCDFSNNSSDKCDTRLEDISISKVEPGDHT